MINKIISFINGKTVLEVIAGGSNGSKFILVLTDEASTAEKYSLCVHCAWRIVQNNKILATWRDNNNAVEGNLTLQLKAMEKEKIDKVLTSPFSDLTISFSSGKVLQIITDINQFNPDNEDENYYLADIQENTVYILNKYYELETSVYDTEKSN